ncbi:hypothetical protein ACFWWC_41815 [Streptomyces sp. NPDC058642]|uniref:hypothetical protein n=1 Tax=Streptomyces sp. NPDC058642 TaxID=3346572 RepID=UPI00364B8A73
MRTTTSMATIPPSNCATTQPPCSTRWPAPESRHWSHRLPARAGPRRGCPAGTDHLTTNQAATVDITWTPDERRQRQRGARPESRTLAFSTTQTVKDTYAVNLGITHTGEQQQGTVTVTVTSPQSDNGRQAAGSFDLTCEPG